MRFVVYGAGAIGSVVGARLAQSGRDVMLIARGAHHDALAADGLRLFDHDGEQMLRLPVAGSPAEADIGEDDVVLLTMKSQQTLAALQELRAVAPDVPVACLQNGVANERVALRRFAQVQAVTVLLPAQHLQPGEVTTFSTAATGILDTGRYPAGTNELTDALVQAFTGARFAAVARPDVMRWKFAKLRSNLANVLQVLCGHHADNKATQDRLIAEAEACFAAAGIDCASQEEYRAERDGVFTISDVPGHPYRGGSSWQSATRRTGNLETDYLNGEIVLLGRTYGVPVPANATVCRLAQDVIGGTIEPGSMTPDRLEERLNAAINAGGDPA